jgi:type II secretory pathway component PulF
LLDAGIRSGNLPGILMNLGGHLELVRRMRHTLWRALSYPIIIFSAIIGVSLFMLLYVVPQFALMFRDFHAQLPVITEMLLDASETMLGYWPVTLGVLAGIIVLVGVIFVWLGLPNAVSEKVRLRIPVMGRILRTNLISRWCDAVAMGVDSGTDLPGAIALADDVIGSPALRVDGSAMVAAITNGQQIDSSATHIILPQTVTVAMDLSSAAGNLAETLRNLSQMYQRQAERRVSAIPIIVTPAFVVALGVIVGFMALALFAPIFTFLRLI